ncbi:glycosyltransferase [Limosilactobacillus pontis]|uniref:glycosyltransferase n=1 Tax=Limosilactobacillus pontis TaxID=35787 RepID=UPI002F26A86B
MIFVTVGTHEQPFNRLIEKVDDLVGNKIITEPVMIQKGFSTYKPKYCHYQSMLSFDEMEKYINSAHIVITHGGPSSFIEVLQSGKIPIVVPRMEKYGEHINNHQVDFVKLIEKRKKNILPVYDINDLEVTIRKYDESIKKGFVLSSNNKKFNQSFCGIVSKLFK